MLEIVVPANGHPTPPAPAPPRPLVVLYRNWEGKEEERRILPTAIRWGSNQWHETPQWLIDVWDCDKQAERTFALNGIIHWRVEADPAAG